MCGINGIIAKAAPDADRMRREIDEMNRVTAHRGPDGKGHFIGGPLALGHRRLAILDLSEHGAQPMFSEDRSLVVVFNGEIYNYVELKRELEERGCTFRSGSDTEVILEGYRIWGDRCVERFNGMWAFALWDDRRQRLLVSRDRLGVKPFYYFEDAGGLVFSSEIKAIAAVRDVKRANLAKVHDYLAYGYRTNDGETFFENVRELKGGHQLVWEAGRSSVSRYWQLPEASSGEIGDPADYCAEFTGLLEDAVRLRFRSDVPVALLQSGGLDSSAIARIVDDSIASGVLDKETVTAFTASFPGYEHDETGLVRELLATCPRIQLRELRIGGADLAANIERFCYQMDEPVYGSTSFAHWSLMKEVRAQGIKVVINGQGSDEAFAGYGRYAIGYRLLDELIGSPWGFARQFGAARRLMGFGAGMLLSQLCKAALGRRAASYVRGRFTEGTLAALEPGFRRDYSEHLADQRSVFAAVNMDRHLRAQLEHYGFNQILHYEDHSAMAHSIEIRSPFIDYRLMEFAFRLPDAMKLNMGVTKWVLRESFAKRLPERIVWNHKKIGFNTPFGEWMGAPEMREFLGGLFGSDEFNDRSVWNAGVIRERFRAGDWSRFPIWRFINLELWARAYGIGNL